MEGTEMKPTVIILRGISGSGKSTKAKDIISGLPEGASSLVVSADHYFVNAEGKYVFNRNNLGKAHAACMRNFIEALQNGVSYILVDNTNTALHELSPYRLVAQAYGYHVRIIHVKCNTEVAAKRNVHGVPYENVKAQSSRMDYLPKFWEKEELVYTT